MKIKIDMSGLPNGPNTVKNLKPMEFILKIL